VYFDDEPQSDEVEALQDALTTYDSQGGQE